MNPTISSKIQEVKDKFIELKVNLDLLTSEKSNLQATINSLNVKIEGLKTEILNKNQTILDLNIKLDDALTKLEEPVLNYNTDAEIDFIVNEIEECIQQIKNDL